jgi:hypothetical protein
MKSRYGYIALFGLFVLSTLACNIGVATPLPTEPSATATGQQDPNIAITYAVQTLQQQTLEAQNLALTTTPTPVSLIPTVTVTTDTNCRTGPNINYQLVTVFKVGASAEVIATYPNYWVIEYVGGNGATCWLWDQYATVAGDTSQLPLATPPPLPPTPTPAPSAPKSPKIKDISRTCEDISEPSDLFPIWEVTVVIKWDDRSENEKGFNIYRDGSLLATVDKNHEEYTDVFTHSLIIQGSDVEYGVQSYNDEGESEIKDETIDYCP